MYKRIHVNIVDGSPRLENEEIKKSECVSFSKKIIFPEEEKI